MYEEIKPLQNVELEILKEFDRICKKHKLKYFLGFGTCLGAVRHHGFIPWDDDIDVIMPLEDYDKLENVYRDEFADPYFLQSYESEPKSGLCYKKLRRSDTTLLVESMAGKDINQGINIDIYPFYHLADGGFSRKWQYLNTMFWMLMVKDQVPKNHGGLYGKVSALLLKLIPDSCKPKIRRAAYKNMTKHESRNTENVFFALGNVGVMKEKYGSRWFKDSVILQFEDGFFPVPSGYKDYLEMRYGASYMELPPESEQGVKLNDIIAWNAEIPYFEYEKRVNS